METKVLPETVRPRGENMSDNRPSNRLTVYFDGGCPVCSREIGFYRKQAGADRLHWVNLMEASPEDFGDDLSLDVALARFHVRKADGSLVAGARAFALMWQQLPRFRSLGRIAALPGVVSVLEIGYRLLLKVRGLWRAPTLCTTQGK
jgi:predicted DCC family thiol-disulfide oxidoreductase YuxK